LEELDLPLSHRTPYDDARTVLLNFVELLEDDGADALWDRKRCRVSNDRNMTIMTGWRGENGHGVKVRFILCFHALMDAFKKNLLLNIVQ
jgi:hypothetical protein